MHCAVRMTGKYPFVLGRLGIELNHIPLSENNVVLTLHDFLGESLMILQISSSLVYLKAPM